MQVSLRTLSSKKLPTISLKSLVASWDGYMARYPWLWTLRITLAMYVADVSHWRGTVPPTPYVCAFDRGQSVLVYTKHMTIFIKIDQPA